MNKQIVTDTIVNPSVFSDEKLLELCKRYGGNALFWRQKFLGLLPEVAKRRLYEKKGFSSIFEFAKKLAGVSEEQVRKVLNLEIRFRDKEILHRMLINGKTSVNKLYKIASIATVENQKVLAEQVKMLPTKTLEVLSRDEKILKIEMGKSNLQNGHVTTNLSQIGLFGNNDVSSETMGDPVGVRFSEEVNRRLLELQKKGININELLMEFLDKREKEIEEERGKIVEEMLERKIGENERGAEQSNIEFAERAAKRLAESLIEAIGEDVIVEPLGSKNDDMVVSRNPNRRVPARIQEIIKKDFGTKCAVPTCNKSAEHLHHTLPFALSQNHDPRYLMPLCKEHHVIAHSVDQKFQNVRRAVI